MLKIKDSVDLEELDDKYNLDNEIIEEEKEIEEIDETQAYLSSNFNESVLEDINIIQRKINELIRKINKLKKEGK